MRVPQVTVPPSDQVQLQSQQWVWQCYTNPEEPGTQEGRICRGEAAEQDDAAAADAVAAAGQKPVGTGAAVREGREEEKGGGNEGRTF